MRSRCIESLWVAALLALGPGALRAQVPDLKLVYLPLDSATVVRLHFLRGGRVTGRLLTPLGPDSTTIAFCRVRRTQCGTGGPVAERLTVPVTAVTRIDVRRGSRSTEGAIAGAFIMIGAAATFCALTDTRGCDPSHGGFVSYVVLPTAVVGAGIGALFGGSVTRWEQAP